MREFIRKRQQFVVFLAGGILSAVIDIGAMQLLLAAGCNYQLATTAGFACGLLFNYSFHAKLTFQTAATSFNFIRYMCVVGINYSLTMASVAAAVHWLPLSIEAASLAGKLLSLPIVAVNGFVLGKYWIFK